MHGAAIVAAAVAGGLAALVVAPWHHLFWIFLVPWLLVLDGVATWRGALASGFVMALAFSAAVFSWFPLAIADYAGAPVWIAVAIGDTPSSSDL
jgi:apolipoprotein N-acyltransferase